MNRLNYTIFSGRYPIIKGSPFIRFLIYDIAKANIIAPHKQCGADLS